MMIIKQFVVTRMIFFFSKFAQVTAQIKQFVVTTNCSKERPGSIVIKNRILVPIATSKESHFDADFKYTSFIKFSLTHQKLRA